MMKCKLGSMMCFVPIFFMALVDSVHATGSDVPGDCVVNVGLISKDFPSENIRKTASLNEPIIMV